MLMLLLSFVLFVTPGSALMFFIFRFIRANAQVSIARTDTVRAEARLGAAEQASAVADATAREALSQTGQALQIARTIELVDEKVTGLTDYLVTRIDGKAPARRPAGRHALPGGQDVPAITSPAHGRFLS
jgi:hypothetical protein